MIKRIRFATRHGDVERGRFVLGWRAALSALGAAPPEVRPVRIAVCTSLPELVSDPVHDGVGIEWYVDRDHLDRHDAWLATPGGQSLGASLGQDLRSEDSPVVVAEELVLRGADWLEGRWREAGTKIKHMALARRAAGLTPAQFSERWQGRSGQIRSPIDGQVLVIPAPARGRAYVQNHPLATAGDWAYDAVNEVYFDDVEAIRCRIDWFGEHLADQTEEDLVSTSSFIAVEEEVVLAG